jgi:serine/threonine-protein kinase RsbT
MATIARSSVVPLATESDIVSIRREVRQWAIEQGFGIVDQTKLVTAASEIARNAVKYATGGTARLEALVDGARRGLRIVFEDRGPGIADVEAAMRDGFTTGGGMGLGLGGSKRLVNEFDIVSAVGRGTTVTIARWR